MDSNTQPNQPIQPPVVNNLQQGSKSSIVFIIAIIFGILILLLVLYLLLFSKKAGTHSSNGLFSNIQKTSTAPIPNIMGYAIQVENVIPNPVYKGDPPNAGLQYLEIDLAINYTGNKTEYIPGLFYYKSASGMIYFQANLKGLGPNTYKNVTIPGKQMLYSVSFTPGKSVNSAYLIYQIPSGDHGQLLWYNPQNPSNDQKQIYYKLFQ